MLTDMDRRTFLKGSVGATAAVIAAGAYSRDLLAQEADPLLSGYTFLNPNEVPTLEAIAEQIWPSDDSIGGRDAGVVFYIDRALSGPYSDFQSVYRLGLRWVNQAARDEFGGDFPALEDDQQLALMEQWLGTPDIAADSSPAASPVMATPVSEEDNLGVEGMPLPGATPVSSDDQSGDVGIGTVAGEPMLAGGDPPTIADIPEFMEIVLTHTIEGLFADPAYGGNRDKAVWTALRYGGPYYIHTEEQQTSFEPLDLPVQSIADL